MVMVRAGGWMKKGEVGWVKGRGGHKTPPSNSPENYVAVPNLHEPATERTGRWDGKMDGGCGR